MKAKGKIRTIAEAFKQVVPSEEPWFKEREEICNTCDYNSENQDYEKLDISQKLRINKICSKNRMCTACGCCLDEKIGMKTSVCGLVELGLTPKWEALKTETSSSKDLDIEIIDKTAEKIDIDIKGQFFIISLGNVPETVKEIKINLSKAGGLKVTEVKAGCSCTVPVQKQINDDTVGLHIKLNTSGFTKNTRFEKNITVQYYTSVRNTKSTIIKLIGQNI